MSLEPEPAVGMNPLDQAPAEISAPGTSPAGTPPVHPIWLACFSLVALATGCTLVIVPWLDTWTFNYLQGITPTLEYIWDEPSFRSALTGLGLLNVLIGLREIRALFRPLQTP